MKKLKTWQIVLLVIFYPVGICVWIYRAIKRSQLKKAREAEQAALSARREAERAEREKFEAVRAQISRHRSERREWLDANCDYVSFKLVGVTFNNDDGVGRNRQDTASVISSLLLRSMYQSRRIRASSSSICARTPSISDLIPGNLDFPHNLGELEAVRERVVYRFRARVRLGHIRRRVFRRRAVS